MGAVMPVENMSLILRYRDGETKMGGKEDMRSSTSLLH